MPLLLVYPPDPKGQERGMSFQKRVSPFQKRVSPFPKVTESRIPALTIMRSR
jgi:hypothetical protein